MYQREATCGWSTAVPPITNTVPSIQSSTSCNGPCVGSQTIRQRKSWGSWSRRSRHYRLPLAETVPLFAALLSVPLPGPLSAPLSFAPAAEAENPGSLADLAAGAAAEQPVLFVVEDLHWIDPSTAGVPHPFGGPGPTARLLTLLTCRPEFQPPWGLRTHLTPMALSASRSPRWQWRMIATGDRGESPAPRVVLQHVVEQDRWCPAVCGRADQDGAGIGPAAGNERAL